MQMTTYLWGVPTPLWHLRTCQALSGHAERLNSAVMNGRAHGATSPSLNLSTGKTGEMETGS